jgi:predicted small secreted protein
MLELSATTFSPAHAETTSEMKNTMPSKVKRQRYFVLVVAAALVVAACTGGAGVDIPIGPVDHSCHVNNSDKALGSGCS